MIKIFLKPIVDSLREESDCFSDEEDEAFLFEQGIFNDCIEVDDGETFIIPDGVLG